MMTPPATNTRERILLTGTTGYVGGRLLKELERLDYPVRCIARRPASLSGRVGESTEVVAGDVPYPASLAAAMQGMDVGGQHVNKVSSAVHLRFDINASSLPPFYKEELLKLRDHRISDDGVITIKAQQHRSQEQNTRRCARTAASLDSECGSSAQGTPSDETHQEFKE